MSQLAPTGYKGQRYEVSCLGFVPDDPKARTVIGWTELPDGGALVQMVNKHPALSEPQVRDLHPGIEGAA